MFGRTNIRPVKNGLYGKQPHSSENHWYLDIKNWTTQNKLQLNSEKTEAMLFGTRQKLSSVSVNILQLDAATVKSHTHSVKGLGVLL